MSDRDEMIELFKQDASLGRGDSSPFNVLRPGGEGRPDNTFPGKTEIFIHKLCSNKHLLSLGLIGPSGEEWSEQRKFSMRHLREFGFGRKSMEENLNIEIDRLSDNFRKKLKKGPIDPHLVFNGAIINALWNIAVGETFDDLDDPDLR